MAMKSYYLRVSGVNLAHSVYDTQDLNTIRGGGLMVLDAADSGWLRAGWPELEAGLDSISTGASVGLWRFCATSDEEAARVRDKAAAMLAADPKFRQLTFVVDVVLASEAHFDADRHRLMALNQHRQMTTVSLAVPEENLDPSVGVCDEDRLRPGPFTQRRDHRILRRSRSVFQRRGHGIEQKQRFYIREIASGRSVQAERELQTGLIQHDFSHHFAELSTHPPPYARDLQGKMAVVYLDGNRFGAVLREAATTPELHREFFDLCQGLRRQFLGALIELMNTDPEGWVNPQGQTDDGDPAGTRYRFETLLWGGDEILWVVPAWKGWETVTNFFRFFQGRTFRPGKAPATEGHAVTFSGGLVFASHKAPIHRLTVLARRLADLAKQRAKREASEAERSGDQVKARALRCQNLLAYEVLESFDHAGGLDLEDFRRQRLPPGTDVEGLILDGSKLAELAAAIQALKEGDFPRSTLHDLARPALRGDSRDAKTLLNRLLRRRPELAGPVGRLRSLTDQTLCWIHLDQMWDYLPAELRNLECLPQ